MKILDDNLILTDNFGIVCKKDYNNPKFDFLKRDKGVPVFKKIERKSYNDNEQDAFGKIKKVVKFRDKEVLDITPEFEEWLKLRDCRGGASYYEDEAFKAI